MPITSAPGPVLWKTQFTKTNKRKMNGSKTAMSIKEIEFIVQNVPTMPDGVTGKVHQIVKAGASLVAQWLRSCLPVQGTQVRALVWEDPTCRGATRPVSHNY